MHSSKSAALQNGWRFSVNVKAEILQRRHSIGKRKTALGLIKLETQAITAAPQIAIEPRAARSFAFALCMLAKLVHSGNVLSGFCSAKSAAILRRKGIGPDVRERCRAARFDQPSKLRLNRFTPAAQERLQPSVKLCLAKAISALANVKHKPDHSQIAALNRKAPIEQASVCSFFEQGLNLQPYLRVEHIAWQPNESKQMARQRRFYQGKARARAINQTHHRCGDTLCIISAKAYHQIMRQSGQCMDERFAGMAAGIEIAALHDVIEQIAKTRHTARRCCQSGAGPDACMNRQGGNLTGLSDRHDKQIKRDAAVHKGGAIGLNHQHLTCVHSGGVLLALKPTKCAVI